MTVRMRVHTHTQTHTRTHTHIQTHARAHELTMKCVLASTSLLSHFTDPSSVSSTPQNENRLWIFNVNESPSRICS